MRDSLQFMTENNYPPPSLFKYGHFDVNGYYKNVFTKNALFFSSPAKFNDPFDCKVFPNYEIGSDNEIKNKMREHLQWENPNHSPNAINGLVQKEFRKNIKEIRSPTLMVRRMEKIIDNSYGIFSLSETNTNILMWSHYSKSHQGYCIEFDAHRLNEIAENYFLKLKELLLFHKITYEPEYPLIDPYNTSYTYEKYIKVVTTKSKDWEYEKEWRLVYYDHSNELIDFPDDVIKSIFWGVNCSSNQINECLELLKSRKRAPELFKATLKYREYGIVFEKLNLSSPTSSSCR